MLAKDLSVMLAQNAYEIARMLYPNGTKESDEWCVGSIAGQAGKSLKIHLAGNKAGRWSDFAVGTSGDLLDLWALNRNITILQAMKEVGKYFNLSSLKTEHGSKRKQFVKPPTKALGALKSTSPVHRYLSMERKLSYAVIEAFMIPQSNDEIIFNYWRDDEIVFRKTLKLERKNGKKEMFVSANAEPCLFGWQTIPANARFVILCEGEMDAMSFYHMGFPALSVPFGGGEGDKQKWIVYEYDRLNRFDEIFVCMDNDETGIAGAKKIIERLGSHRCRLVELPMKDANECLINGFGRNEIEYYLNEAKSFDPHELRFHSNFKNGAYEIISPTSGKFLGYRLGWDKCGEDIIFRPSGLSMWTGYNGHGKTLFLGQVILNMLAQGAKVCIASMELYPEEFCARMYMQATGQEKPTMDFIDKIDEWIDNKLTLFNLVGTAKIERLLEVFLYARRKYGVDVFVVDSLTTLNIAEDDYNGQKQLTEMLRDFKLEHNCHIHLVAHPRKPKDESIIPGKYDIRGGGAISDLADNCFAVWRNKAKEEISRQKELGKSIDENMLNKADAYLKCDKNRHGRGKFKEGIYGFWFNEPTGQYLERDGLKPKPYIEYSCLDNN